jgi:putative SOS response-associated peptidase YedK
MLFSRNTASNPARILRMVASQPWQKTEALRISPKPCMPSNPGARRLVIRREGLGELALTPMRWGLRADQGTGSEILARPLTSVCAEVVGTNAEWRRMLNSQRCVVPAERFFEWKRVAEVKTREYCMRLRSGKPLMLAGLWNRSETSGETFAYLSCDANPLFSLVHNRMPVVLEPNDLPAWFNPDTSLESLMSMLRPIRVEDIELYAVAQQKQSMDPRQGWLFDRAAA